MKRIGMALSAPRGTTQRKDQYGIYDSGVCVYEGYREQRQDGEAQVGLPLGGPGAAHLQPHIQFVESNYEEVRWFEGSLKTRFDRINESEGDDPAPLKAAKASLVEIIRSRGYQVWEGSQGRKVQRA